MAQIQITEAQLHDVIAEAIETVMSDEGLEEGFFGNMVDKIGAAKDAFQKGGAYNAHFANRQLQRARGDIQNLKNKYDVQDGQNATQYVAQNTNDAIAKINSKYDQKIQALQTQRNNEIEQVKANIQKQWSQYQGKKQNLDQTHKQAYQNRRAAMNANPYADFKEE